MKDRTDEMNVQSFIVKIWIEEIGFESNKLSWRGHITQVPGSDQRYVKSLEEITDYFQKILI